MNPLGEEIARSIQERGPMPFAEFMDLCLYHPVHGYYRKPDRQIGREGDFITSISVGNLFGRLLAEQFARWRVLDLGSVGRWQLVEAGAHDGQLARDILTFLTAEYASAGPDLEYWIVEPSEERQSVQRACLRDFPHVRWAASFQQMPSLVRGVIFSNELLDALPVIPIAWDASGRCWMERNVALGGKGFVWAQRPLASALVPQFPAELLEVLPNGYVIELTPAAEAWWRQAAQHLECGRLLAVDYGGKTEELLQPERLTGTLRAYSRHQSSLDVLASPGQQDLTAHVNFSNIEGVGESAGLRTTFWGTQQSFLGRIAREWWEARGSFPPEWIRQFQTLTHPEHLGRPFRVLVQQRGPGAPV